MKLYEKRKGKEMHMSGSWKADDGEQKLVTGIAVWFAVSVVLVLVSSFVGNKGFKVFSVVSCGLSFVSVFAVLWGIVYFKNKKEPMEKHYYDVDYEYSIKDGVRDDTKVISKEDFKE